MLSNKPVYLLIVLLVISMTSCGGGSGGTEKDTSSNPANTSEVSNGAIELTGNARMGQYLLSGDITAYKLDINGVRTGEKTEATPVNGNYKLSLPWPGLVELELQVSAFVNELDHNSNGIGLFTLVSHLPIDEDSSANINIFTHIVGIRVNSILAEDTRISHKEAFSQAIAEIKSIFGLDVKTRIELMDETDGTSEYAGENANLLLLNSTLTTFVEEAPNTIRLITAEIADDGSLNQSTGFDFSAYTQLARNTNLGQLTDTLISLGYDNPPDTEDFLDAASPKLQHMLDTGNVVHMSFSLPSSDNLPVWVAPSYVDISVNRNGFIEKFTLRHVDGLITEETYDSEQQLTSFLAMHGEENFLALRNERGDYDITLNADGAILNSVLFVEDSTESVIVQNSSTLNFSKTLAEPLTARVKVTRCGKPYDNANVVVNLGASGLHEIYYSGSVKATKVPGQPGIFEANLRIADPAEIVDQEVERCETTFEIYNTASDLYTLREGSELEKIAWFFCKGTEFFDEKKGQFCSVFTNSGVSLREKLQRAGSLAQFLNVCEFFYRTLISDMADLSFNVSARVSPNYNPYQSYFSDKVPFDILHSVVGPNLSVDIEGGLQIESIYTTPEYPSVDDPYEVTMVSSCVGEETPGEVFLVREESGGKLDSRDSQFSITPNDNQILETVVVAVPAGAINDQMIITVKPTIGEAKTKVLVVENDPPLAEDLLFTIDSSGSISGNLSGHDRRGASVKYRITQPIFGVVGQPSEADSYFTYLANNSPPESDSFTYVAYTIAGESEPATVTITSSRDYQLYELRSAHERGQVNTYTYTSNGETDSHSSLDTFQISLEDRGIAYYYVCKYGDKWIPKDFNYQRTYDESGGPFTRHDKDFISKASLNEQGSLRGEVTWNQEYLYESTTIETFSSNWEKTFSLNLNDGSGNSTFSAFETFDQRYSDGVVLWAYTRTIQGSMSTSSPDEALLEKNLRYVKTIHSDSVPEECK